MGWSLSQFRAGELVEVRRKEDILATLDANGCFDGMPFMPEMLQFCGRQLRVRAVAHKTCDTVRQTGGRRLHNTVHLSGARCDGSAHDGCQAECNLFWKDVWLKAAAGGAVPPAPEPASPSGCTEEQLMASTRLPLIVVGEEPRWSCQATRLHDATKLLPWWSPRQYLYDFVSGNHSFGRVVGILWLAWLRRLVKWMPVGYRLVNAFSEWMHRLLTGRPSPDVEGKIGLGQSTPTGRLNLKPGERVRIKPAAAIAATLDERGKNRGLSFDREMMPFCGQVFTVRSSVTRIIDEPTGRMIQMKQPCIMLEGVVCNAEYSECRLLCPRAIPSYCARSGWSASRSRPGS